MAALSPFRFFAAWRVEALFFRGFPFRWGLHLECNHACCYALLYGGPCDNTSCLFFTALWLQHSLSILVQEIQPAKNFNLTCFKTLPIKATTCLQVLSMYLDWPVDPFAGSDQSRPSSSHEDPNDEHQGGGSFLILPLEAGCPSTTSGTAWYCRSRYMWPLP